MRSILSSGVIKLFNRISGEVWVTSVDGEHFSGRIAARLVLGKPRLAFALQTGGPCLLTRRLGQSSLRVDQRQHQSIQERRANHLRYQSSHTMMGCRPIAADSSRIDDEAPYMNNERLRGTCGGPRDPSGSRPGTATYARRRDNTVHTPRQPQPAYSKPAMKPSFRPGFMQQNKGQ